MASNQYAQKTQSQKLMQKSKDSPFIPIGLAGMIGALGYGAYQFKYRGEMSPSVFFMHLRVQAQGMIVGAITIGVAATLASDYFSNKK